MSNREYELQRRPGRGSGVGGGGRSGGGQDSDSSDDGYEEGPTGAVARGDEESGLAQEEESEDEDEDEDEGEEDNEYEEDEEDDEEALEEEQRNADRRKSLAELRTGVNPANAWLEGDKPSMAYLWNSLTRIAPACFAAALIGIIINLFTTQYDLCILYTVELFVTGIGTYIVRIMKVYTLVFLFAIVQLAALGAFLYYGILDMNDVYHCQSNFCNHGKKWLYNWNWAWLWGFVAYTAVLLRALFRILTSYEMY